MPQRSLSTQVNERFRYWEELYGFTFVLGGPFRFEDCQKIARIQNFIAKRYVDMVEMGDPEARHLSLGTSPGGRSQPFQWKEKGDFTRDVFKIVGMANKAPFDSVVIRLLKVSLRNPFILLKVTADGVVYLRKGMSSLGINPIVAGEKKTLNKGHITLGVVKQEPKEKVEALSVMLKKEMNDLSCFGIIKADKLTVAHYRIRSFDKLLGSVVLSLGKENGIDEAQFWRQLNLRD